jgi:MoaA/NifB/PqqE/SkfB family radical SAM enzyme
MRYDIEADWHLLNTCNYRCTYCFFPPEMLGSKLQLFANPEGWRSAFDASGYVWLLHMTGGEPSLYPDFVELCEKLTENHYISINSNLTHSSLEKFARRIDPTRVSFINAGLHLEERELRSGNDRFIRHADLLRSGGFRILISLVATPLALARFDKAIALLEPIGLFPVPKLFRGVWNGDTYPRAYSLSDKARFRDLCRLARKSYGPQLSHGGEAPSIDLFNDEAFVDGLPIYKGSMCEAGARFVQVLPNGDIYRCGMKDFQGNLLSGTFVRRLLPAPCDNEHCYYFCNKYSAAGRSTTTLSRATTGA